MADSTENVRLEIEQTRDRMSRTLDEIEGRIIERKEEIWARATLQDLRHRVSADPWRPLLIAFAAGYIFAAIRD